MTVLVRCRTTALACSYCRRATPYFTLTLPECRRELSSLAPGLHQGKGHTPSLPRSCFQFQAQGAVRAKRAQYAGAALVPLAVWRQPVCRAAHVGSGRLPAAVRRGCHGPRGGPCGSTRRWWRPRSAQRAAGAEQFLLVCFLMWWAARCDMRACLWCCAPQLCLDGGLHTASFVASRCLLVCGCAIRQFLDTYHSYACLTCAA